MHAKVVLRIIGFLLMLFSTTLIPPTIIAAFGRDDVLYAFASAFIVTLATGVACWLPVRHDKQELRFRDGFLVVVLFWTVLATFGALPFILLQSPDISITNAFFESMSGLTTTGATVLTGIDELPRSILYYRQQLQWLGGMGIIVLAVAVLPVLGIGGMQLYRAEAPGPVKNSKLKPRIAETAKALWIIYLSLTVACMIGYWLAGMTFFDAIAHSFSTVAIGGFSTHDASLGYYTGSAVPVIAMFFMVVASLNFALHFTTFTNRSVRHYLEDTESRTFLILIVAACVCVCALLIYLGHISDPAEAILHGSFQVVSIATTTGFTTHPFSLWPATLPTVLIMLGVIGGCAGSTAGGMKVIRAVLLYKQGKREITRLVHPNAIIPIKLNGRAVPDQVINAVWGFFALYVISFAGLAVLLTATGLDQVTAFSAVAACINNLGPGLGAVAENYDSIPAAAKWILAFAMLLGRLEMFTILVLFTRTYWRS